MIFENIDEVTRDIIKGRCQTVLSEGRRRTYLSPGKFDVDVLEVLENLKRYEAPFKFLENLEDEYISDDYMHLERCIERVWGKIENYEGDNTYNWNARLSNNIDFKIYEMRGRTVVIVQVHLYGDVRCNYSGWIVLSMNSKEEFIEAMCEASRETSIETKKWIANIYIDACSPEAYVVAKKKKQDTEIRFESQEWDEENLIEEIEKRLAEDEEE